MKPEHDMGRYRLPAKMIALLNARARKESQRTGVYLYRKLVELFSIEAYLGEEEYSTLLLEAENNRFLARQARNERQKLQSK